MPPKLDTDEFIKRAQLTHGNKYDYSLVNYITGKTPVDIVCPVHGIFKQKPAMHIFLNGCYTCGRDATGVKNQANFKKTISKSNFDILCSSKHGSKFDIITTDQELVYQQFYDFECHIHGIVNMRLRRFLKNKNGCCKCSGKRFDIQEFIRICSDKHDNVYDYSNTVYLSSNEKVTVLCPHHGPFSILASNHIQGQQCKACANMVIQANHKGGYSDRFFIDHPDMEELPMLLYVVRMVPVDNLHAPFYKVGITKHTIKKRFAGYQKRFIIEHVFSNTLPLYTAFNIEQAVLQLHNNSRYHIPYRFGGWTECFTTCSIEDTLKFIDNYPL